MKTITLGKIMKLPAHYPAFHTIDDAITYDNPRSRRPHAAWALAKLFGVDILSVDNLSVKINAIYATKNSFVARVVSIKDPFATGYVIVGPRDSRCKIQSIVFT